MTDLSNMERLQLIHRAAETLYNVSAGVGEPYPTKARFELIQDIINEVQELTDDALKAIGSGKE